MREKLTPNPTHEDIAKLEYVPGEMFVITVAQGNLIDGAFVRDLKFQNSMIVIQGGDLTELEANPTLSAAINTIMAHAWAKVDEVV